MKKLLYASAAVVLAACSCNKMALTEGNGQQLEQEFGNITIGLVDGSLQTRATAAGSDATIASAQVIVFDGSMNVGYGSGTGTITVNSVPLNKTLKVYAVANCAADLSAESEAGIKNKEVQLASYTSSSIPMYESAQKTFSSSDLALSISMKRAASKVQVNKITTAFSSPALKAATTTLTGVYIYKAPGKYKLSLSAPSSQVYYHSSGYSSADVTALGAAASLVGDASLSGDLTGNKSYTTPHYFWCCPNEQEGSYLTLVTSIGGTTYYYGIPLGVMAANSCYTVTEARITGLGSTTAPGVVTNGNLSVTLTVTDWTTGFSKEVTF